MGAFGEKLRKQREQRGLELDAISNTTKISPRMLRALEDEHFDQLPGGVFNKGFVRAYARQVGLDEEETIADYLAALRESQIQQQAILPDFRSQSGTARKAAGPELLVPTLKNALPQEKNILHDPHREELASKNARPENFAPPVPMTAPNNNAHPSDEPRQSKPHQAESTRLGPSEPETREKDRRHAEPEIFPTQGFITGPASVHQNDESAPVPWKQFSAALVVIVVLFAFWNLRRHTEAKIAAQLPQPVSTSQTSPPAVVSAPAPDSRTSPPTGASTVPAPKPAPKVSSPAENPAPIAKPAAAAASKLIPTTPASPVVAMKNHAPAVKPPPTFTLLIRAEKTTWVSIVADGKPVAEETLIAPANTSVRAAHEIYVRTGNAAGVSFVLNGKEILARGAEGEVKAYVFDAAGWHAAR